MTTWRLKLHAASLTSVRLNPAETFSLLLPWLCFPLSLPTEGRGVLTVLAERERERKKKSLHRHNHKSCENSQISTVAVQSAPERNKLPPSTQTQTLKCDFVSLVIVCIYSLRARMFLSSELNLLTEDHVDETNAFVWHFTFELHSFLLSCERCLSIFRQH